MLSKRRSLTITEDDRSELAAMKSAAREQSREARSILADAKVIADKCRESRKRNHYRYVLDEIFSGGKS